MTAHDVLVLAEIQRNVVTAMTGELLGAARELTAVNGGQVVVLVLSPQGASFVPALAAADRIVLVNDPLLDAYSPAPFLAALRQVVVDQRPHVVLIGGTSIGWDLAPMLATQLQAPLVTGCKSWRVDGSTLQVTAALCGGKLMAEVEIAQFPAVLMVQSGAARPAGTTGQGQVETFALAAPLADDAVRFDAWLMPPPGDVDITQQDVLVAVGRGIQHRDNVELAHELAEALGGTVCASRPVVDQGWLPATRQVGKSGMTVKPKLYLALGISGAPEHVEGMEGADLIIAVNTDPQAPIFDAAHYGAEVDVLELLPALVEAVRTAKA
ncbi:MAG: electron transfer flavoprotein subunit alpha/FixB family protein [Pirellulaceae bacterium]